MDSSAKLSIINPQPAKLPGPALLHELVAGTSSSPALDHLQGTFRTSFTYDELHAVSDTIADKLSSVVRNRDAPFVVPILMRQSPLLYASLLGILKAGAAFCPLNLDAPPERVSFIIQDVSAAVVLVEEDLVARMPEGVEADVMTIQWMSEKPATSKHSPKVSSTDLAYVMYTSGSTGTPKGVGLSHGAATQALLAHERHIPQFSRFLQFAAPTFDVSVFEIFFPLARGRTLVSVERGQLLDDLAAAIRETNVDACELTPTVAGSLLRSRNAVPELKLLLTIGEMLTEPVIHEFGGGEGRESILWAMYGPTEATIHCTLQPAMQAVSSVQNIGFPLDTVSAFVIQPAKSDEEALTVLPLGEVGELAVGGHQLAEGYLNRPTQTAAAFIETPYGRLYRTGDKARVLSNGTLECLGRLSEGQVKLRGQRLEINEVQQAILRVKSCHGAVVAVHESTLVAFCATDPGVLEDVIRDECKKWLPQFMIPSVLMLSDSFPKLPSGKVDKRKLLADYATNLSANTNSGEEHGIPGSFMSAFMDILGPHVEAHTILPAAGLDSLSAIRIASSLGAVGYPTSAASLIKCKSVADAWHLVRTAEGETEAVPASSQRSLLHRLEDVLAQNPDTHVAKFAVSDILPCSALQTAMLAETVGQPDLYWNELELDVADSANRVAAAFTTIIEQTAILRGIFVFLDGTFVCLVKQDVDEEQIKIVDGQSHFSREQTIDSPTFQVQLYDNNHGGTRVWILAHHAIYDGWSMDIILADVNRLLSGQSIPKRTPFAEVVAMQRWLASSPAADRSGAYWAAHLQGWTKDPFPTLVDRLGGQQDPLVIADQVEIPYPKVDAASKDLGCSVQALFQAALYVVWAGILGSTDVVLGVVSSGRSLPMGGIEEIIGPCIAALPLRVDFEKLSDAEQLLRHIHSCNRAMLENSIIPLGDIRKMMGLRASQTVYDLLFVYQQSSKSESKRRGLLKEIRRLDRLETKVLFEAEPNDTSFSIQITYHSDSARGDMMRMLLQQFKLAFGQLIEQSHSALADTRRALIPVPATYNTSPVPLEGTPDLAAMFEQVVEENSDKDALSFIEPGHESPFAKTTVTYQELNVLGNRIAHFLLSQGVGANQIVGVFMEKSIFLYATILAVLKTGCAYLPLPPSTPADRVEDILRLAKVRHCAVDTAAVRLFGHLREARLVDVERTPLDDFRSRNLCIPPDRDRLAYVIFTSGTTGTPKGVAVTHGNIVSNIDYLSGVYPVKRGAQSNFLQACSQAFDVSVFEIFFAWKTGMCLCTGVNDTLFADLALTVNGLSITHLSLTPTVASLISRETCPGVEFLVTAGEPLTRSVLDQWGDILWQGYGPSETTNICSVKQMQTDMVVEHLGWVFPNTSVMVMAIGSLDPVPVGWVGEFCYGGDQVAQGYLNMPELTAEKFIQHPRFGRIYHSGDIGRMLPDGSLVILGRIDDQLKLRGQRIEAAEISNIIASTPWASSAIVMIGRRAPNMPEQLVAFYVPAEHVGGDGLLDIDHEACAGLYSLMQSKLPSYMVPSYLIPLARIPMTKSGKINKKQLQDWFQDLPSRYLEAAVPQATLNEDGSEWSTMESDIHAALIQSLKISATEANRWTPFANLGIDSVSAIRLARDLSSSLNRRVAVSSIIRNSSIAQFARHLGQHDVEERAVIAEKPLLPQSCIEQLRHSFISQDKAVASILPCTPLQAAMLSRGGRNYYNRVLLRLKVEASKMQAFWNCMTERHEILRTCFATTEDAEHSIAQVVLREWSIPWHQFDAKTPSFEEIIHSHLEQLPDPVDAMTPPVSLALIRRGTSSFLSFICHHSLYDGVAINILWREVEALAAGEQLPPAIRYEPLLQEMANLPGNTEAFWKKHFHDFVPSYAFPSNAGGSTDQALITKSVRTSLETLNHRLKGLGVSMLAACQAAWAVTLSISYKSTDICFGNVNSGRTADVDSIERLVAPTFNTIPLRVDLSTASHGHSLLEYFHRLSLNVFPYQFTPLRLVQKISGCQGVGLFETLLLLQQPLHPMDDRVWILEEDKGTMDLPVVCEIVPCPSLDSLVIDLHYDMNFMDPSVASALAGTFVFALESLLESPYAILSDRGDIPSHFRAELEKLRPRRGKGPVIRADVGSGEWSADETTIRKVVAELSKQSFEKVARNTTIFQLGLDSINAVQIASKLRQEGLDVSSAHVLEYPTCAALAEHLKNSRQKKEPSFAYDLRVFYQDVADEVSPIIATSEIEAILPCSPMQCALHTAFLQTRGHHYFNSVTYKVNSSIGIISFTEAWKLMCRQHPMLRTALVPVSHPDTAYAMVRHTPMYDLPMTILNHGERVSELVEDLRASLLAHPQLPPWHVFAHDGEDGITMTLVIHHALYDAQSLDELLVGLGKTLQGEADELNITPVEPGLQVIMSRHMADQTETRLFWESKATDVVINTFPTMTPLREPATSLRSETSTLSLSFSHLQDAAKDAGVTVHAAIHAAWARVLSSYLGEEAVVFGSTISERTSEATKSTPIPCITTLPVLARATPSNLGLLESIMDFTTKVRKHQSASLSSVQKWLGHPATPIFDTLVSYRKRDEHEPSRPFELLSDNATLDYKVSMEIEAGPDDCVRLTTTFMPHVLPAEQGRILLDQFDAVLSHLVLHPGETEDDLHRLTPKLFSQLPPEVPVMPTTVQYLHQLVEEKARTNPETIALEFIDSLHQGTIEKRIWNYRQLDERGNQVANMLRTKAAVGSIVAVHFDKCPEAYFSILGILKAGCSFVALDPTAPASRKSFILEDSKAPCVLTTAESTFSSTTTEVVRIDMSVLDEFSIESAVIDITSPEATCYCLYTSGTTGTPKGCEITHENAVQAMMAFQDLFSGHWQADSRWLQFASLHFDVSVLEQYWTWSVGITLVAAPKDMILDDLTGSINKLGITHIDLTPSLARLTHPSEVPSLCKGVFITGGESLKQEILDVWGPKAVIHNAYGPTEATIGVTMYQRVPANGRPSNIGKQFPNVGSYVFKLGTEVPVLRGGVGELCVSGKLVGKGYLNRPDLTAERFPTLQHFAEKIYRTGDLVRVLHDGCFEFLGRADDQVKLRGQRLEIGEINHAIRGVPEIQDAATVVATQGSSEKSVLVAFIVSATTNNKGNLEVMPDTESLGLKAKEACRTKLPGYMVPTYFLQLPFIPLSVNNKAEAKELRRLFANLSHAQLSALTATPRSSRSTVSVSSLTKLTKALSTYSGLKQNDVTEDTSMFDLGVDSITVLRLASHLKEQGFDAATPTALLRNPVINDLAFVLCQKTSHSVEAGIKEAKQLMAACKHRYLSSACRAFHVQPENIEYIAPCSPLQGGIVSRSLASAEGHAYFNTFELKLSPHLSEDELRHAWDSLVSELAILRTRFLATPSGPIQVALKAVQLPWEHVELPTEEETQHALTQMRKAWLSTNGHNVSEPLQIYYVVRGGESRLFINIFHGIYDGMSFDFMLSRLAAEVDGRDLPDGPLFVEALTHGPLQDFSSSESFWKQHLRDWMPPVMAGLGGVDSSRPVASSRIIPQGPIDLFRRSENTTLQAVLLGVWSSVLQKYHSGVATVGVIAAGRSIDLPGIENTIGPLFNTLPFFHKFQGQDTWASLIHSAHDFGLSTLDCQHVSLQHIQKWCSGGRPLFNTLFALQIEQPEDHGLWQLVDGELNPDYPLAFEATMMKGGNLRVQLVAQGHVATVAVLDEMLGAFSDSLRQAMKDSSQSVPFEPSNNDPASSGRTEPSIVGEEPPTGFTWTEIAETIRREICALSGASEGDIRGTTTMLELGLDSIDVMKLSAALRRCGVELAASQIMRLQSVSNIVSSAEETTTSHTQIDNNTDLDATRQRLRDSLARSAVVDMADVEDIVPATPLQESMVTAMVESDFQWYFNHDLLQLSEDADVERLKKAWTQVVEAHPILRTGFYPVEDDSLENAFYQVIYTKNDPWVECLVTESLDEADRVMERCRLRAKDGKGQTALLQLSLMSVGSQRFVVLSMAHALYDGWSLSLLYRELQNAYHGQLLEARSPDIFLCRLLEAPSAQSQEFWSDYLQGARPTHLGVSLQTEPSTTPGFSEATSDMRLDTIKAFCKDLGITMQTLCQASWALVLAYYTKQLDIIFGVIMSGRDFGGAEELMFPTMNTVAMRYILHGTARSFLQYVEESMSDVRQYQSYPLRKALTAARAPMGGLFNTLFMLQKSAETGSSTLVHSVRGVSAVDYPVCVEAEVEQGQLSWRIAVQPGFVPLESPSNLLKQLDGVLSFLIKSPDSDLLSFTAAGISLGGLPSFTIKEDAESEDESRLTTPLTDDEDWSGIASTIRSVLSQASGVDETSIRMTDTLYHLGLDSISSLKVSRLLKQQDLDLRPRDLIRAESIAHLVEMATANQSDGEGSQDQEAAVAWQLPPSLDVDGLLLHHNLQHSDVEAILPALPMQVFVLGTWQNTNGAVFNPMFTYELDSACSKEEIMAAWGLVTASTPILRTRFMATGDKQLPLLQVVLKSAASDLVHLQPGERTEAGTWHLRLHVHHALYDGVSLPLLMQHLLHALVSRSLPNSSLDLWNRYATNPYLPSSVSARKAFWTSYLSGVEPDSEARTGYPIRPRVSYIARSAVRDTSLLQQHAAAKGVGVQSLFLAAYAKVLLARGHEGGGEEVVFGVYLANRQEDTSLDASFPRLNLVPLRVKATGPLESVARRVQRDLSLIMSQGRAAVGLWEVEVWTGVRVTSFVNFLSLPDRDEEYGSSPEAVRLRVVEGGAGDEEPTAYDASAVGDVVVRHVFPPAMDIEASLRNRSLDIGIFGPEGEAGDAQSWVSELVHALDV